MLSNPELAVEYGKKNYFEKILLIAMAVYTIIIVNDCIAIVLLKQEG